MKHITINIQLKSYIKPGLLLVSLIFLLLNILASQTIDSSYFNLINNDKNAVINFLKKIKPLPEFKNLLITNQNIFDNSLEKDVFSEDLARKTMINNFEQLLNKNPSSRDILYSLFLLYNASGDKIKTREYFNKVQKIDPNL